MKCVGVETLRATSLPSTNKQINESTPQNHENKKNFPIASSPRPDGSGGGGQREGAGGQLHSECRPHLHQWAADTMGQHTSACGFQ